MDFLTLHREHHIKFTINAVIIYIPVEATFSSAGLKMHIRAHLFQWATIWTDLGS